MNSKLDYLVDSIYKKLKKYNTRKIILEKETLKQFLLLISKDE